MKNSETNEILRLKNIIDSSNIGTWEWNVQTGATVFNEVWAQIIGYTLDELSPTNIKTWEALSHPDDLIRSETCLERHFKGELPYYEAECRMKHRNGQWVWVRDRGKVTSWTTDGKPLTMSGSHIDITEYKKAEEILRKGDKKLNVMISNISDVIAIINMDGIIAYTSPNIEKSFGWKPQEIIGTDGWLIVHPDDLERMMKEFVALLQKNNSVTTVEYRMKCKDGSFRHIEMAAKNLVDDPVISGILLNYHDFTDRKKAEESLRKSDEDLRESQRIAHVGSWRLNISTNEVTWSEELYKMYGFDPSLPPPPFNEHKKIFTPDSWNRLSKALSETIETGLPYELELETVRPDGSHGWMWVHGEVVLDKNGSIVGLRGAAHDITGRIQANMFLKESEEKYRLLYTAMDQGLALHEIITNDKGNPVDYVFLDINASYTHLLGITREMSIGKRIREVMPNVEQYWIDVFGKVALTGESNYYENYLETTGKYYSTYSYSPKKNQFAVLVTDITERKLADEATAAEKEKLAVTLRSIGDGVITTDTLGNIEMMNKVAEKLCGWKQEEAQGKLLSTVFNIINENTRQPHVNPVEIVLDSGDIIELANHTLLISRNGTERIIEDSGAPIRNKESKTIGVVLVFRDVTEKEKINNTMQRAQKLESLGVLAGGIAHDFNNLMGGIFGYIDLAREEPDRKIFSSYLSKAMETINRARALTEQLLTFAKGGAPVQKVDNLFPFVEETAKFALSGANISCHFNVPLDLWACNFDKNQIGQVVDNLFINAQQAMPVGGTIELTAQNMILAEKDNTNLPKGNYVKISIKDEGIGISKELLPKIFDPFFSTKTKGHGLGLAMSYSIVKRHGGYIDVESEQGKGSTFHIYLPSTSERVFSIDERIAVIHNGRGTFLVMDDEKVMRDITMKMLKSFGYTVECKIDGQSAVDFFVSETKAERPIKGMIFDLTVPGGMGGKAAIDEIRKLDTHVPAFVASGYAEDPIMKKPLEYGFTASICKPFRKSELSEMLNRFMK